MRTAYRRRTCRLCGDFRQDHLRRQMTDNGNRIGRVPATTGPSGSQGGRQKPVIRRYKSADWEAVQQLPVPMRLAAR
jgi:hypothetical protein